MELDGGPWRSPSSFVEVSMELHGGPRSSSSSMELRGGLHGVPDNVGRRQQVRKRGTPKIKLILLLRFIIETPEHLALQSIHCCTVYKNEVSVLIICDEIFKNVLYTVYQYKSV